MAYRFEPNAERPADLLITPSGTVDVPELKRRDRTGFKTPLDIQPGTTPMTPRVIRLEIESTRCIDRTSNTYEFYINLTGVPPLRKGTVLVFRDAGPFPGYGYVTTPSQATLILTGFDGDMVSTNSTSTCLKTFALEPSTFEGPFDFSKRRTHPRVSLRNAQDFLRGTFLRLSVVRSPSAVQGDNVALSSELRANLVAFYRFRSGAMTADSSGNALDGTIQTPANPPLYSSERGGSLQFTQPFASLGGTTTAQGIDLTSQLTGFKNLLTNEISVSLWYRTNATGPGNGCMFSLCDKGKPGDDWALIFNNGTTITGLGRTNNVGYYSLTYTSPLVYDNNWHHLVYSTGSKGAFIYFDSMLVASSPSVISVGSSFTWNSVQIGFNDDNSTGSEWTYNGYLSDVTIFNRTLSGSEVALLYNDAFGVRLGVTLVEPGASLPV